MAGLHSSTSVKAREDRAIYRALSILEKRMRSPGQVICSPQSAKDYLKLLLGGEEREVFTVLYLDAQNRLIEAETLFYGTLTQTAVYPREVVRRALFHNSATVMFAHNHPSGNVEPSQADMTLTSVLKNALALVDVRVLDHFIIAGNQSKSFAECGLLGLSKLPEIEKQPMKRRGRPRKDLATAKA